MSAVSKIARAIMHHADENAGRYPTQWHVTENELREVSREMRKLRRDAKMPLLVKRGDEILMIDPTEDADQPIPGLMICGVPIVA